MPPVKMWCVACSPTCWITFLGQHSVGAVSVSELRTRKLSREQVQARLLGDDRHRLRNPRPQPTSCPSRGKAVKLITSWPKPPASRAEISEVDTQLSPAWLPTQRIGTKISGGCLPLSFRVTYYPTKGLLITVSVSSFTIFNITPKIIKVWTVLWIHLPFMHCLLIFVRSNNQAIISPFLVNLNGSQALNLPPLNSSLAKHAEGNFQRRSAPPLLTLRSSL